jgi:pimeloyl-ACP methyl ester carboxylesterase
MRRLLTIALGGLALLVPATAHAVDYAPVDRPGPPLTVPQPELDASLGCGSAAPLEGASRAPVLLIHGTGSDPENSFSWNWQPALDALGIPWCTVALVDGGMADIQTSGEHVVHAIRTMRERSGRRIAIIGHSQGGMIGRWALRFWPDTRAMVDDLIGFAPSNHGTELANVVCVPGCAPSFWQQAARSQLVTAVNSVKETFAGIDYTVAYTHTDWVVVPNFDDTGSSSLRGGDGAITNVAIQDVCPLDVNEHLAIGTIDNVAYSLAIDALEHPGPADPSRLDPAVCNQPLLHPGVDPLTAATDLAAAAADLGAQIALYPHVAAEPPLRCYVLAAGCPAGADAPGAAAPAPAGPRGKPAKKKAKKKKRKKRKRKRKRG